MSVSTVPIAIGWLNQNALRAYPFHEGVGMRPNDSTGALIDGGWTIPTCLLVDMSVAVPGAGYDPFLYLSSMSVVDRTVSLTFSDSSGSTAFTVAADANRHEVNQSYEVAGVGSFLGARGSVCLGDLDAFLGMTPAGAYAFSKEETRIEPTCIRPSSEGVRSVRSVDADGYTSVRLAGDVSLVAGPNIRFDCDPSSNSIWISADPNSGYAEECECGGEQGKFVRSVNGIAVEKVVIIGDDCVDVSADTGSGVITISDKCAKPCCGCAETAFINQTINDLQTSVGTLMDNVATLGARLETFIASYVLSRKTLT